MATATVKAGPIVNNGGTILAGGTVSANSVFTQSLGSSFSASGTRSNGSIIAVGASVAKAISAGALATMTAGKYVGMIYPNSSIAGIASNLLIGGAGYSGRRSENSFTGTIRTQKYITTGGWVYQTGKAVNRTDQTDTISNETPPTMLIPGKLTYLVTGSEPTVDTYKAKTD